MNKTTVDNKLNRIIELKKEKKLIEEAIACLVDSLKNELDNNGNEYLYGNKMYCYYKDIKKQIIDNDKLKQDELYNKYLKVTEYKMFDYKVIK